MYNKIYDFDCLILGRVQRGEDNNESMTILALGQNTNTYIQIRHMITLKPMLTKCNVLYHNIHSVRKIHSEDACN